MALRPRKQLTQRTGHRLVAGPAVEPVSLEQVRAILRDPPEEDDDFIMDCIPQAREVFEAATGLVCIQQTWRLTLDHWPGYTGEPWWQGTVQLPVSELHRSGSDYVSLPRYPLASVESVTTYDLGNEATSVTVADVFYLDTASQPGRLVLNAGSTWPVALRDRAAIEIEYKAGFGTAAANVPATLQRAIAQIAAYMFENRGTGCTAQFALTQTGALSIASEYVKVRL